MTTRNVRSLLGLSPFLLLVLWAGCHETNLGRPAMALSFVASPASVTAGTTIIPAFQVAILDDEGNTVVGSQATVTVSITGGTGAAGAVLGGTVTRSAVSGVATFDDLTIDRAGADYTLTATSQNLASASSSAFIVSIGPSSRLQFTVQPGASVSAQVISPAVRVTVLDGAGNIVSGSNASITVAISGGSGTAGAILGGTLTRAAVNGVATFDDLTIDKVGAGYQLTATASGLTSGSSSAFVIVVGAAARLAFTVQPPAAVAAGAILAPPVRVTVQDAQGNTVTGPSTVVAAAITPGTGAAGAVLGGTQSQPTVGGVATFGDLAIDKVGTYTLTANAAGLAGATSSAITVTATAPGRLVFTVQPGTVTSGAAIAPALQVAVQDSFGNPVTGAPTGITLAITAGSGTAGAVLGGTTTQTSSGGVAAFGDLTVDKAGAGYTLTASAPGLTGSASATFTVSPGADAKLVFEYPTTAGFSAKAGVVIVPPIRVTIQDAAGNTTSSAAMVSIAITAGTGTPGAGLRGTLTRAAVSGVVSFEDLSIDLPGPGYSLTVTATNLAGATSVTFAVYP